MSIKSARSALAWAGGVQVVQDIAQFAAMLVLVRWLSPIDYGAMALAQSVLGVFTLIGPGAFVGHAVQARDPTTVDWQSHFTASVFMSAALALVIGFVALTLAWPIWGPEVAIALAMLSLAVLFGGPATVHTTYLHAHHDWARYRILSLIGTFLGLGIGVALGIAGAGVIALAVQPVLGVLPPAIDLFRSGFRPTWRLDWGYYSDAVSFGINRAAAGSTLAARVFVEQSLMAANFTLVMNGIYSRSIGLSNLLAGRPGGIAVGALYPIITRAERGSQQFQHAAHRVLQGVAWSAVPAATYLSIEAKPVVALLYGSGWGGVADLIPFAAPVAATGAILFASGRILLANESRLASLSVDLLTGLSAIIIALLILPNGPGPYLLALAAMLLTSLIPIGFLLVISSAVTVRGLLLALTVPIASSAVAACGTVIVRRYLSDLDIVTALVTTTLTFGLLYAVCLLGLARKTCLDLLLIVPGADRIRRLVNSTIRYS